MYDFECNCKLACLLIVAAGCDCHFCLAYFFVVGITYFVICLFCQLRSAVIDDYFWLYRFSSILLVVNPNRPDACRLCIRAAVLIGLLVDIGVNAIYTDILCDSRVKIVEYGLGFICVPQDSIFSVCVCRLKFWFCQGCVWIKGYDFCLSVGIIQGYCYLIFIVIIRAVQIQV